MTDVEQREAARQFINKWKGRGNEDMDGRSYWIDLLSNVVGMERLTDRIVFEKKVVVDGNKKRIDAYIPETHVLIEQKSLGIKLDQKIHNSGDIDLTPYEQAKRYNDNLPYDEKARWIVTSNFAEIWIYDMNKPVPEPVKLTLSELQDKYPLLEFFEKKETKELSHEMEVSIAAGEIVGLMYDAFYSQYGIKEFSKDDTEEDIAKRDKKLKSLNALCVRLVFCLYAEDAAIFGKRNIFHDYLEPIAVKDCRRALIDLFKILDTPVNERDDYLEENLAIFPYVNGGLFSDETIEIPQFTDELKDLIIKKASEDFDWSKISPTIFGAVFESTLNPDTRRSGGMHYTSIENIHKLIDPLFLDELKAEFEQIKELKTVKTKKDKLEVFQNKLSSLTFLDPACGSGNFLTETYLSLRRLENELIATKVALEKNSMDGQLSLGFAEGSIGNPIKVSIQQFYGIEINDFAATVAKTALWIAESQMMKETQSIVFNARLEFLPLKTYVNITEGNALRIDWNDVIPANELNYIMGNPPFIGYAYQNQAQKDDLNNLPVPIGKNVDYVCGWYFKAALMMQVQNVRTAFVSTNSICQGEQVVSVWEYLIEKLHIHIDFAYQTFRWDSEALSKAAVHCVIVGFSSKNTQIRKSLFLKDGSKISASNISPYLVDAPTVFIQRRSIPICNVPSIYRGSQPTDDGNLILTIEEKEQLLKAEPQAIELIRPYMMGKDFIDRKTRYCLWLVDASPNVLKRCPKVLERVDKVRAFRLASKKAATRAKAETPTLFDENHECKTDYIAIPKVSSERRRYIPMDYLSKEIIAGDKLFMMPNASLYSFGILESNVHMAWMRTVAGRLKSDYSYSNTIVYNNFPWANTTDEQRQRVEKTAQGILDARALYPDSSLADLYDPLTMPIELRKAHIANDKAVMAAYGFSTKMTEADCVAALMKMYQELTENISQ